MSLLYEKRGQVAVLTLSRPEARNAWCAEYNERFIELMPQLEDDRDVRCVVLTGDPAGNAFSAGADLKNPKTHMHESVADFIEEVPSRRRQSAIALVTDFSKPIIAAVNGYAIGIGCIVTYCCDMIVASEAAEWRLPQAGLGIIPAQGGSIRLARWIGKGQAMRAATVRQVLYERGDRIHRVRAWILQIRAGTERAALIVTGDDDAADIGVCFQLRQALAQSDLELLAPGVACLGATERQDGDGTASFAEQRHSCFLLTPR